MSFVAPKLLYSQEKHGDVPVWHIVTGTGRDIYIERVHHKGYRPIGVKSTIQLGKTNINVFDVVSGHGNNHINILTAKDGYIAPMSWYEPLGDQTNDESHKHSKSEHVNLTSYDDLILYDDDDGFY